MVMPEKEKEKKKYYAARRYIQRSFEVYPGFPWPWSGHARSICTMVQPAAMQL